jgi:hypothetical protein
MTVRRPASSKRFADDLRTTPTDGLTHDVVETGSGCQIIVGRVEVILRGTRESRFHFRELRGGGNTLRRSRFDQSMVFPCLGNSHLAAAPRLCVCDLRYRCRLRTIE